MCDFIARTNWSNIERNYFVHTIIIFDLSYYTNITITVTFMNHLMLCRAFFLFLPKYYPHKSCTIFHINLYVFNIHTEIPKGTNKLNHVKRLAVCQNYAEILGDPYSKKSPLPSIGDSHLSITPRISGYQFFGLPRLLQQHTTHNNHYRMAPQ
jgi:hypothetical protein